MRERNLQSQVVALEEITATDAYAMYEIFARHYDCVSAEHFLSDLAEKDCVLMLRNGSGEICGFSTQQVLRISVAGKPIRAVFSGDTIVDQNYWGDQELGRCWCRYVSSEYAAEPDVPLYWFLISKGYRTYLYLPLFFEQFYPNCAEATPANQQRILDALAMAKFPNDYRPGTGLIEFSQSQGQLKPHLAEIPPRRLRDPNVKYFLRRNPYFASGHELACLAEISPSNMKHFAGRIIAEAQALQSLNLGAD